MTDTIILDTNIATDFIVDQIKPLLAGHHPGVQGIVLADLLAIWLAGHPETITEPLIDTHIRGARQLLALYRQMQQQNEDDSET